MDSLHRDFWLKSGDKVLLEHSKEHQRYKDIPEIGRPSGRKVIGM